MHDLKVNYMKKKQIVDLIKTLEVDKLYFEGLVFDIIDEYLQNHPNYQEKCKNGHNGYIYVQNKMWGNNNYCLNILNDDNELIPISYNFSLAGDLKKKEVLKAFRSTIEPEVMKFKKTLRVGIDKCAITGEILTNEINIHVVHNNYDFKDVVTMFLNKYNKTYEDLYKYVIEVNTKRFFNNKDLIRYFIDFHNKNTTLRFTTATANLKKTKNG